MSKEAQIAKSEAEKELENFKPDHPIKKKQ